MNKYFRLNRILFKFPKTVFTYWLIKITRILPWIIVNHIIDEDGEIQKEKVSRRKNNQSTGHYIGNRKVIFLFKNIKLFSLKVIGEQENTLLHFYLLRKSNIFESPFYENLSNEINIEKKDRVILEPGCNTGKMLYHFKDKLGGKIIGADIDKPAIDVANKFVQKPDIFYCIDTVNSDFLNGFIDNEITLCILSSHIKHIIHYDNFESYFKNILRISKIIIIHEKYKEQIIKLFQKFNIPKEQYTYDNNQIFGFIRSENL